MFLNFITGFKAVLSYESASKRINPNLDSTSTQSSDPPSGDPDPDDSWQPRSDYDHAIDYPVHSPSDLQLPDFDHEVPEDWVRVEGEFVIIYVVNAAYIGSDMKMAPGNFKHYWLNLIKKCYKISQGIVTL